MHRRRPAAEGRCRFELPALPPGGPHRLAIEGSTRVALEDVWLGEVLARVGPIQPGVVGERRPRRRRGGGRRWVMCDPVSVCDVSAVGYSFARDVHRARHVPVGIIDATWGGTCNEAWTSLEALGGI